MIPSATRYSKKYYTVTCSGPCRGIGIKLQYSSGDADLCAKYAIPIKKFRYCEKATKFVKLVNNVKTKCEIFFKFFWLSQNNGNKKLHTFFYFRENSIPTENDSENCDPTFCQSTSSSKTDQCSNIRTQSNKFFVLVNAHGAYTNGVLSFSGSNLLNVKSYQMS